MRWVTISDVYDEGRRKITIAGIGFWWPFPVAWLLHSSAAQVLGWPVYGDDAPGWIQALHKQFYRISDARWWLKYRLLPKHQYHLVRTGLEPGYHDYDERMLHAAMALLCKYVAECEGEEALTLWTDHLADPTKQDPNAPPGLEDAQAARQSEALTIYRWWTVERPANQARRNELVLILYSEPAEWKPVEDSDLIEYVPRTRDAEQQVLHAEFRALEKKICTDEQAMLHRLVDIRPSLWT